MQSALALLACFRPGAVQDGSSNAERHEDQQHPWMPPDLKNYCSCHRAKECRKQQTYNHDTYAKMQVLKNLVSISAEISYGISKRQP